MRECIIADIPSSRFISYYPLKQGLKLNSYPDKSVPVPIYILLSIKTRIETFLILLSKILIILYLYPTIH